MTELTIITVNLNNAGGLEKTIRSVAEQHMPGIEFIVVDGASSDGSVQVIEQYRPALSKAIIEKDSGIYEAMNKGIRASSGRYLLFLNSGDYLTSPDVMSKVIPLLDGTDVICGDMIKIVEGREYSALSPDQLTADWFFDVSLHHQATFVRRTVFDTHGLYNESYRLGGDYEFFIRVLLKHNSSYKRIPLMVSYFPATGISNQKEWLEINLKEKQRTWDLHFSKAVQKQISDYRALAASAELSWGRRILRRLRFLKKQ